MISKEAEQEFLKWLKNAVEETTTARVTIAAKAAEIFGHWRKLEPGAGEAHRGTIKAASPTPGKGQALREAADRILKGYTSGDYSHEDAFDVAAGLLVLLRERESSGGDDAPCVIEGNDSRVGVARAGWYWHAPHDADHWHGITYKPDDSSFVERTIYTIAKPPTFPPRPAFTAPEKPDLALIQYDGEEPDWIFARDVDNAKRQGAKVLTQTGEPERT